MSRAATVVIGGCLVIIGGALLGWGLARGTLSIIQWAVQQQWGTSPTVAGVVGGAGGGMLVLGRSLLRQGNVGHGERADH